MSFWIIGSLMITIQNLSLPYIFFNDCKSSLLIRRLYIGISHHDSLLFSFLKLAWKLPIERLETMQPRNSLSVFCREDWHPTKHLLFGPYPWTVKHWYEYLLINRDFREKTLKYLLDIFAIQQVPDLACQV